MAKSVKQTYLKRKGILIASSCISGLAVCFLISALATDFWITCGEDRGDEGYANVHYGLFKGRKDIKINILAASSYDIFIICDEGMKECMYSCAATEESRLKVLQNAIAGINTGENCDQGSENRPLYASLLTKDAGFTGKEVNGTSDKVDLVSYELWLSTVIFLAFAIVMSLVTFGFTVYNALGNPILTIVGPRGLYIWNGASIFLCIFPLTLWGAQLIVYLSQDPMISESLDSDFDLSGCSRLDYSYWLILGAAICHIVNVPLVKFRNILRDPPPVVSEEEDQQVGGTILLF